MMSTQIRQLIIDSISDLVNLFKPESAHFRAKFGSAAVIDVDTNTIRLDPTPALFSATLQQAVDRMTETFKSITPIHIWFEGMAGSFLHTSPDDVFVTKAKAELNNLALASFVDPTSLIHPLIEKYSNLLHGGEHDRSVRTFISEEQKFDEYKHVR